MRTYMMSQLISMVPPSSPGTVPMHHQNAPARSPNERKSLRTGKMRNLMLCVGTVSNAWNHDFGSNETHNRDLKPREGYLEAIWEAFSESE